MKIDAALSLAGQQTNIDVTLQDDNLIDPLDQHYSITVAVKALNQTQQEPIE